MAVVDHERGWLALKKYVASKSSHGKRDLLEEMTRIEIECEVPEGQEVYDGGPRPELHRLKSAEEPRQDRVASHG